eukprot:scaffold121420_cov28-Tisochrysis_lutea.AAC.1
MSWFFATAPCPRKEKRSVTACSFSCHGSSGGNGGARGLAGRAAPSSVKPLNQRELPTGKGSLIAAVKLLRGA